MFMSFFAGQQWWNNFPVLLFGGNYRFPAVVVDLFFQSYQHVVCTCHWWTWGISFCSGNQGHAMIILIILLQWLDSWPESNVWTCALSPDLTAVDYDSDYVCRNADVDIWAALCVITACRRPTITDALLALEHKRSHLQIMSKLPFAL